eukprot:918123-Rhodomonas_salina.3
MAPACSESSWRRRWQTLSPATARSAGQILPKTTDGTPSRLHRAPVASGGRDAKGCCIMRPLVSHVS